MEGYIAEIRMFASNFAPRNWQYCAGQQMSISQNTALFSLLGTTFGGNGQTTFGLPDFRGRVAVGTGSGGSSGLNVILGEMAGTPNVTLLMSNLPSHTHTIGNAGTVPVMGTLKATMAVDNQSSSSSSPGGNYLAIEGGSGLYASTASSGATMNTAALTVSGSLGVNLSSIQVGISGQSQPLNNTMPSLGMNYVICIYGIFPSRN